MKITVYNWIGPTNGGLDNVPGIERDESGAYCLQYTTAAEFGTNLLMLADTFDVMLQGKPDKYILWLDTKGGRFRCR